MMVHLALRGPIPWRAGADLGGFAYVHIAPYVDDLARTYAAGLRRACCRPSRCSSSGRPRPSIRRGRRRARHVVWIQVRALPAQIAGDARGEIAARAGRRPAEPYAERVIAKLERYAPGPAALVLARAVLSPGRARARATRTSSAATRSPAACTCARTSCCGRSPAARDYESGVRACCMTGAATWPGAGVNALSGYNVAQQAARAAAGACARRPPAGEAAAGASARRVS